MTTQSLRPAVFVVLLSFVAEFGYAQPPQPSAGQPQAGRPEGAPRPGGPREGGPGGPRMGGPGQGPGGRMRGGPGGPGGQATADPAAAVARMFTLDANNDGKLSKDEVTDKRLFALGERADADKDGNVTREELTALFTKEAAAANANRMQGGPGGEGFGGPGPGGRGQGGPGQGGRGTQGPRDGGMPPFQNR